MADTCWTRHSRDPAYHILPALLLLLPVWPAGAKNSIPTSVSAQIFGSGDTQKNRVHFIMVGDGFRSGDDQTRFRESCGKIVEEFFKHQPYSRYKHFFTVSRVDVTSDTTVTAAETRLGNGNPDVSVLTTASGAQNTAYASWILTNADGTPGEWPWFANLPFSARLLHNTVKDVKRDLTICVVNSPLATNGVAEGSLDGGPVLCIGYETKYGEENKPYDPFPGDPRQEWGSPEVMAHEVGHAFAGLEDEYWNSTGGSRALPPGEPPAANVTREGDASKVKWIHWKDKFPGYGHYEGGATNPTGIWRCKDMCKMRVHQGAKYVDTVWEPHNPTGVNKTFELCPVCQEAIIQKLYSKVSLVDKAEPEGPDVSVDAQGVFSGVGGEQKIVAKTLAPEGIKVTGEWQLDDNPVPPEKATRTDEGAGPSFELNLGRDQLPPGNHEVKFTCQDKTPLVAGTPEEQEKNPVPHYAPCVKKWKINVVKRNFVVRLVRVIGGWLSD